MAPAVGAKLTEARLLDVKHPDLRREAAAALARGEEVRLIEGKAQTVVLGSPRAGQALGSTVVWGEWRAGWLHLEQGNHRLDADGVCTCPACETAAGLCGDDDE